MTPSMREKIEEAAGNLKSRGTGEQANLYAKEISDYQAFKAGKGK